jgi:hypothetical protein
MPRWLRDFTFQEINNFYKKEKEEYEKAQSKSKGTKNVIPSSGKVTPPNFKTPSKSSYN